MENSISWSRNLFFDRAGGSPTKGTAKNGDREKGLVQAMIGKAETPKATLLIFMCHARASPL